MTLPIPTFLPPSKPAFPPLPVRDVCPHCKRPVTAHAFRTGDFINCTYHCIDHGDVVPMRSAVWNED